MKRVKLSDAFDLQMGKTPSRKCLEYWRGGTEPWISIADLSNCGKYIEQTKENITSDAVRESNIKIVPKNTVVMSFKLSIGKTAITKRDMYTNEAIMAFHDRGRYEILTDYLYYFCKGNNWTVGTNKAVMGLTLNKKTLSEQTMLLPDMPEQEKIVKRLDALQEIIINRQRVLTLLDELVRSRFVEMFGDPAQNPKNLPYKKLGEVIVQAPQNGMYKPQEAYVTDQTGTPILRIDAFYDGEIEKGKKLKRLQCTPDELEKYSLQEDDIVINRVNSLEYLGKCAHIKNLSEATVFESNMMRLHLQDGYNAVYVTKILCSQYVKNQILNKAKEAVNQASINQTDVQSIKILVPPLDVQNQFATFVHQVDATKASVQAQLDSLTTLCAKMMQDFFS